MSVPFEIKIVEYPTKQLAGMKIQTNMQKAMEDCPKVWETFMPHMAEVNKEPKESFGVSVMINENDFEYWAALEIAPHSPLPDGMQTVGLTSGTYACCTVPSIEKLGDAYMYLYTTWIQGQSQSGFVMDSEANAFERYYDWDPSKPFEIYMPIKKR